MIAQGMEGNGAHLRKSWFVCQTNAREEKRAKYFLEEKGFEVYLPMMEAQRVNGSRPILVRKPLFTSYLFVRFNEDREIPHVRWTQGVRKILPDNIRPVGVDDQLVEAIRALANREGVIQQRTLRKRDRVRILGGPFKELVGIFEEWTSDRGRIRILLQCVNCQARLELHHSLVEKVA